jgi:hypothetical protein
MTQAEFEILVNKAFKIFQDNVPNKNTRYIKYYINHYGNKQRGSTGNMAFNALQSRYKALNTKHIAEIYIDDKIAPYVYYTNERWLSQKWKGHKNPNEGWVLRGANKIALFIAKSTNGKKGKWQKGK